VLRRPPHGKLAPKAHDMEREYQFLKELHPYFPEAPQPYLFADESVIGKQFFLMERKRGIVLDTEFPKGVNITEEVCWDISNTMVDTLVKLHSIDYKQTKLKDMTKPTGFMERQVYGWIKRYERAKTDDIERIDILQKWMMDNIPNSEDPAIIHYDFKLNNAMFSNDDITKLIGLFDWEMATVGDPLADLGTAMSYWVEPDDSELLQRGMGDTPVTASPGFMTRNEFIQAYARKSGRDVSNINFYLTFAYFKLAVICQQIYFRWKSGQTNDERFAKLNRFVNNLIQYSLYSIGK
jgi:aminoglycoside phosphotransferase (APT) family kinase protein